MKTSRRLALCLLLGVLLLAPSKVLAEEDEEYEEIEDDDDTDTSETDDADVAVLTKANFDTDIGKSKYALVMFYAPWCGHCKSLKPEYAKAATLLKSSHPDVLLAKVDATEEQDLGTKYDVSGYPTLKWFVDGKLAGDYSGGRSVDTIIQWIKKKTGPPTTVVASLAELEAAKKEGKVLLLGYFDKFEGEEHKAYEAFALAKDGASFLKTSSKEVAAALGVTSAPGYVLGRSYDDFDFEAVASTGHDAFKAADSSLEAKLDAFLLAEKLPPYIQFKQSNSADIFQSGIEKQVITVAPGKLLEKGGDLEKAIIQAAKGFKGKLIFVVAKLESADVKPITQFFGMKEEAKEPQVVGFELSAGKKYMFDAEKATATELEKFAAAVVEGTAKKFFKSAKEPEVPTEGGVTVVVGNTVEKIVKDPTKDVLLEVYAPWCGHCKSLAPIYEKLAKRFAKIDSVVIAKMDGTENEHPDVEAQGFPTLLFFPAEAGAEPQTYEGGRTLAEMTKYLKQNAKIPFELPKKKKGGEEVHEEL